MYCDQAHYFALLQLQITTTICKEPFQRNVRNVLFTAIRTECPFIGLRKGGRRGRIFGRETRRK